MEQERFRGNEEISSTSADGRSIALIAIIAVPKDFEIYKYISPREGINCKQTEDVINLLINSPYFTMDTILSDLYLDDTRREDKKPNFTIAILLDVLDQLGLVVHKIPNYTDSYFNIVHMMKGKYHVVRFITFNIFALINDTDLIEKYLERAIQIEQGLT